eukprot:sb/3475371/
MFHVCQLSHRAFGPVRANASLTLTSGEWTDCAARQSETIELVGIAPGDCRQTIENFGPITNWRKHVFEKEKGTRLCVVYHGFCGGTRRIWERATTRVASQSTTPGTHAVCTSLATYKNIFRISNNLR